MYEMKYPHLFEPIRLGNVLFRNRLFASPQDYPGLTSDNFLTPEATAFYELKAQGGFASVCIGDCVVDGKYGHAHKFMLKGDDVRCRVSLTRTAQAIIRHGAVANIELLTRASSPASPGWSRGSSTAPWTARAPTASRSRHGTRPSWSASSTATPRPPLS